jgi:hypothetical protein
LNVFICFFLGSYIKYLSRKSFDFLCFSTAFYGLSLIAQTPDGAMSLKDFGWETYRVRAHSIPSSIANTDTYQCAEKRMSKLTIPSSSNKNLSPTSKRKSNESTTAHLSGKFDFNEYQDSGLPELKSKRSLTMPSSILLNSNEIPEIRHSK